MTHFYFHEVHWSLVRIFWYCVWELDTTPERRQSKTQILSRNVDKNSLETEFSIAILSPNRRQMTIENTVSIDFWSAFVDCLERFRLPPTRCDTRVSINENLRYLKTMYMLKKGKLLKESLSFKKVCVYDQAPRFYFFSYSFQLSMKFFMLINIKMPTSVGILTFISRMNTSSARLIAWNTYIF